LNKLKLSVVIEELWNLLCSQNIKIGEIKEGKGVEHAESLGKHKK
jgi:hypothetical protein